MSKRIITLVIVGTALLAAGCTLAQTAPPTQAPAQPPAQPPAPALAPPSFDCKLAKTVIEKEICAIPEFGDLDGRIAALYAQALTIVSLRDAEALRADQRVWLKKRDACGDRIHGNPPIYIDVYACLRDELNTREALLRVVVASKQFTKP